MAMIYVYRNKIMILGIGYRRKVGPINQYKMIRSKPKS